MGGFWGWKPTGINSMVGWERRTKEGKQLLTAVLAHITGFRLFCFLSQPLCGSL